MFVARTCVVFCKQAQFWGNSGDFINQAALIWGAWAQLVLPKSNVPSKRRIQPHDNRPATRWRKCGCYRTLQRAYLSERPLLCFAGIFFAALLYLSAIGQYWADALTTAYLEEDLSARFFGYFKVGFGPL